MLLEQRDNESCDVSLPETSSKVTPSSPAFTVSIRLIVRQEE